MKNLFINFWKEYPRKVGKKQSLDAWLRLKPTPELYVIIMEALLNQKRYKTICDEHNIWCAEFPHPVRWIKHERWEDEVPDISSMLKDSKFIYKPPKNNLRDER